MDYTCFSLVHKILTATVTTTLFGLSNKTFVSGLVNTDPEIISYISHLTCNLLLFRTEYDWLIKYKDEMFLITL